MPDRDDKDNKIRTILIELKGALPGEPQFVKLETPLKLTDKYIEALGFPQSAQVHCDNSLIFPLKKWWGERFFDRYDCMVIGFSGFGLIIIIFRKDAVL